MKTIQKARRFMRSVLPRKFHAGDLIPARRDFSRAIRSEQYASAEKVIKKALKVEPSPSEVEQEWANFCFRSIRSISSNIPLAVEIDLYSRFLKRFPSCGVESTTARTILDSYAPIRPRARLSSIGKIQALFHDKLPPQKYYRAKTERPSRILIRALRGAIGSRLAGRRFDEFISNTNTLIRDGKISEAADRTCLALSFIHPTDEEQNLKFMRLLRAILPKISPSQRGDLIWQAAKDVPADTVFANRIVRAAFQGEMNIELLKDFDVRFSKISSDEDQTPYIKWGDIIFAAFMGLQGKEFMFALRAGDIDSAVQKYSTLMTWSAVSPAMDAARAKALERQLWSIARLTDTAKSIQFRCEFINKFWNHPSAVRAVANGLIDQHGLSPIFEYFGQGGMGEAKRSSADLLSFFSGVLRQRLGFDPDVEPPSSLIEKTSETSVFSSNAMLRHSAIRLTSLEIESPQGKTDFFIPRLISQENLNQALSVFGSLEQARFVFDNFSELDTQRNNLKQNFGIHDNQIFFLSAFDLRTDDEYYARGESLICDFIRRIEEDELQELPRAARFILPDLRDELIDRSVPLFQKYCRLLERLERGRRLIVLPVRTEDILLARDLAEHSNNGEVILSTWPSFGKTERLTAPDPNFKRYLSTAKLRLPCISPELTQQVVQNARGCRKVICAHLADKVYVQSATAIAAVASEPLLLLSFTALNPSVDDYIEKHELTNIVVEHVSVARSRNDANTDVIQIMAAIMDKHITRMQRHWAGQGTPIPQFVLSGIARALLPTLSRGLSMADFFMALFEENEIETFVVTPGRPLPARIGVRCARACGIRSVDIQAGTTSRLKRYRPPQADMVTCLDRPHWHIYSAHFGVPQSRIAVTGSPRIDAQLADIRTMSKHQLREELFDWPAEEPLLLVGTQPIEIERMTRIVEIAMKAAEWGWNVAIKPHPRERADHLAAYHAEHLKSLAPDRIRIDPELDVYKALQASDVVATYYSSVGQEGFSLRKKVLVIDPFEVAPDPDYVGMGLAKLARNEAELKEFLAHALSTPEELSTDPYLSVLQDGGAAERVWGLINAGPAPTNPSAGGGPAFSSGMRFS